MATPSELRRQAEELLAAAEAAEANNNEVMEIINVTVGRVPGLSNNVMLDGDRTLGTALSAASLSADGGDNSSVRVNGRVVTDMSYELANGDRVTVIGEIRGN